MNMTWITVLKYLGLVLTLGTSFIGSWFLEYTTTNKETGRKHFTPWGRRAVVFAGSALITSLLASVWSDYDAANKQKSAAMQAQIEKANAVSYQQKSETAMADIQKLLTTIAATNLNNEDKAKLEKTVASLRGIEDYKKYYPDLYQRIMDADSYEEVSEPINEGLYRAVNGRISNEGRCNKIPRPSKELLKGYPGGNFMVDGSSTMT